MVRVIQLAMLVAAAGQVQAGIITFDLSTAKNGTRRGIQSHSVLQGEVTLTIDNPNGIIIRPDNAFSFILGGLFIDGGVSPNVDLTFSEDVKLVSYTVANTDFAPFDLVQGSIQSLGNSTDSLGTFSFTNLSDTWLANQAIALRHSSHDLEGFSLSSITVNTEVPEPSTAVAIGLLGVVGFVGNRRRRRTALNA